MTNGKCWNTWNSQEMTSLYCNSACKTRKKQHNVRYAESNIMMWYMVLWIIITRLINLNRMLFNLTDNKTCQLTLTIRTGPPCSSPPSPRHPEQPAITLILRMAALTFVCKSTDDYNYGEWLSSSLRFQRPLLKHAAGSVNGTIKIIDCTGPINKTCFQLGAAIRLILIMEKPSSLHCSAFALFSPGASHILWVGFHVELG